jgi:hypothetical protein
MSGYDIENVTRDLEKVGGFALVCTENFIRIE